MRRVGTELGRVLGLLALLFFLIRQIGLREFLLKCDPAARADTKLVRGCLGIVESGGGWELDGRADAIARNGNPFGGCSIV